MTISGDVFRINQVYELLQKDKWPTSFYDVLLQGAGFFGGGGGPNSIVERINFNDDTVTASTRGPLSLARSNAASTGNNNYGWFAGGFAALTRVDRITYTQDSDTASVRANFTVGKHSFSATGNSNYGWFGAGTFAPGLSTSSVDRIDFADDTNTASTRGPLSTERYSESSATGNSNFGWFGGGYSSPNSGHLSLIDRITFATDTATASVRAPLSSVKRSLAATGNDNYGWFGGGINPAATPSIVLSRVDRLDFVSDLSSVLTRGPLSVERWLLTASSNDNYGWFGGGAPGARSTVDRITFATDTATASARGPLGVARNSLFATSGAF